jgi:hypothetical protein
MIAVSSTKKLRSGAELREPQYMGPQVASRVPVPGTANVEEIR